MAGFLIKKLYNEFFPFFAKDRRFKKNAVKFSV